MHCLLSPCAPWSICCHAARADAMWLTEVQQGTGRNSKEQEGTAKGARGPWVPEALLNPAAEKHPSGAAVSTPCVLCCWWMDGRLISFVCTVVQSGGERTEVRGKRGGACGRAWEASVTVVPVGMHCCVLCLLRVCRE